MSRGRVRGESRGGSRAGVPGGSELGLSPGRVRFVPAEPDCADLTGAALIGRSANQAPRNCGLITMICPSTPLMKRGESSVDSDFAASTASLTATAGGTSVE